MAKHFKREAPRTETDRYDDGMPGSKGAWRPDPAGTVPESASPQGGTGGAGAPRRRIRRRAAVALTALACVILCAVAAAGVLLAPRLADLLGGWDPAEAPVADGQPGSPADDAETEPQPTEEELLAQEVDAKLSQMTLEQKVAQMFIVRPESITGVGQVTAAGEATRQALAATPVGGIVYFADNLQDTDQARTMLANTLQYGYEANGLPLFLCVDEEGGTVSRVGGNPGFGIANVGDMCDIGATGDTQKAYDIAHQIGSYLTDLGFNVDFAPDADIANNPEGTMGLRSFGATADVVAPMVAAQVRGFTDAGILCAAKHFPGIGGAAGDSHGTKIYSQKTADEMAQEELVPFQAAIDAGAPFIMVGHLSAPAITGDEDPASISSEIVTGLLRERLGYDGIIITDSMGMGAATSTLSDAQLAVEAVRAGVDIVLMPADFNAAYQGVLDAVASSEIDEARIDESVRRILTVKLGELD